MKYICVEKTRLMDQTNPIRIDNEHGKSQFCKELVMLDKQGEEIARIVWKTTHPWRCKAQVWIETECDLILDPPDMKYGGPQK